MVNEYQDLPDNDEFDQHVPFTDLDMVCRRCGNRREAHTDGYGWSLISCPLTDPTLAPREFEGSMTFRSVGGLTVQYDVNYMTRIAGVAIEESDEYQLDSQVRWICRTRTNSITD